MRHRVRRQEIENGLNDFDEFNDMTMASVKFSDKKYCRPREQCGRCYLRQQWK